MSEVKKCPKCGGEMQKGSLFGYGGKLIKWTSKESQPLLTMGETKDISAFLCKNCGYVEIYMKYGMSTHEWKENG